MTLFDFKKHKPTSGWGEASETVLEDSFEDEQDENVENLEENLSKILFMFSQEHRRKMGSNLRPPIKS